MILVAPTAFNEAKLCNSCPLEHRAAEKHQPEYSPGLYKSRKPNKAHCCSKVLTDPTTTVRRAGQEFPTQKSPFVVPCWMS